MIQHSRPAVIIIFIISMSVILSGCFQEVGDAVQPGAVSQSLPTASDTPMMESPTPSLTPTPVMESTDPAATATVETQAVAQAESAQFLAGSSLDQPVSDVSIGGGTAIAQAEGNLDDGEPNYELTATEYVAQITRTVEAQQTATAEAQGIGVATATPTTVTAPTTEFLPGVTPTATQFVAQPGSTCIHIVQVGDNLWQLSQTYGVSINELASASGITNIQLIVVGDEIIIPGCGTTGVVPPPTPVPEAGNTNTGTGGTTGSTGTVGGRTHTVQQGETLFEISLLYGVPVSSIAAANGISNINNILMTTVLTIPAQ